MNMVKNLSLLVLSLVMVLAFASAAQATITIDRVELDDVELSVSGTNDVLAVDRGDEYEVEVQLTSDEDVDDVQVEAVIRGYDHDDSIEDLSDAFDMKTNTTYVKRLSIPVRDRLDQDQYRLRVRVDTRDGETVQSDYTLEIEADRHDVVIRDVILNPENEVRAGRALLASVRVENEGQRDEDDLRVRVSIPSLGLSATSYIDELERSGDDDDSKTSEEMFLRIPDDTPTGEYTLRAEVSYDEGDEVTVQEVSVRVIGCADFGPGCPAGGQQAPQDKTIITLATDAANANAGGAEVSFPVTITNAGSESKVYTIMADGANWGTFTVTPSNVLVVDAGESKAANVNVKVAENAPAGQQTFLVSVKSDNKVLKQIPLKVNVAEAQASGSGLKSVLEVGLIVLLILVVVVGLVLGFTRKREEDEGNEGDTYY